MTDRANQSTSTGEVGRVVILHEWVEQKMRQKALAILGVLLRQNPREATRLTPPQDTP
jgi:hypothetical protein